MLASWPRLSTLDPWWFAVAVGAQTTHFACTFALQRLALRTRAWFPVVTSQLAGNAITLITPGGAAVGAALQFRMLAASGAWRTPPSWERRDSWSSSRSGRSSWPTTRRSAGPASESSGSETWSCGNGPRLRGWTRLCSRSEMTSGAALGRQWWQALLLSAGRLAFDYLSLLAALRATGSNPRPSLILVAYAVAGIVGMIPITPGGLGLVEASLTGLLVLAEVNSSQAVLATLTYRIASYWLPLCAGPIAYAMFRIRYRSRPASPQGSAASPADSALCQDVAALRTSVSNLVNIHGSGNTVASVREDMNDVLAKFSALRKTAQGTWNPQLSMLHGALTQLEGQVKGLAGDTGSASGVVQALGRVRASAQRLFDATKTRCPQPLI